jgi:hypothetical protein
VDLFYLAYAVFSVINTHKFTASPKEIPNIAQKAEAHLYAEVLEVAEVGGGSTDRRRCTSRIRPHTLWRVEHENRC